MGRFVLFVIFATTGITTLFRPWVGVIVGYIFAIFGPQFIWFWSFEGVRPFYFVVLPTLAGFFMAVLSGRVDLRRWSHKVNIFMAIIWGAMIVSYILGPYVHVESPYRFFDPRTVFSNLNKMFFFYFICVALIDSPKKIALLGCVLIISTLYMTYWANMQYLEGRYFWRLSGPSDVSGGSLYRDENNFAMLFVTGLPFVYYAGYLIKNKIFRLLLWLVIPFGWHAVFLTGSRGGLLGLGVSLAVMAWRSPKRWIGFGLLPALVIAYTWQGGPVMKQRATTITEYETESSARTRLEAWEAALGMIKAHPITGIGVASFGPAFPDFSTKKPRVAHNSFFQISAEWGLVAGIAYLTIVLSTIVGLWRNIPRTLGYSSFSAKDDESLLVFLANAVLPSWIGLCVCSLFLSLQGFEITYFMIAMCYCILEAWNRTRGYTSSAGTLA